MRRFNNISKRVCTVPLFDAKLIIDWRIWNVSNNMQNHKLPHTVWDDKNNLICWTSNKNNIKQEFWTFDTKTNNFQSYPLPEVGDICAFCDDGETLLFEFERSGLCLYKPRSSKMVKSELTNDIIKNSLPYHKKGLVDNEGRYIFDGWWKENLEVSHGGVAADTFFARLDVNTNKLEIAVDGLDSFDSPKLQTQYFNPNAQKFYFIFDVNAPDKASILEYHYKSVDKFRDIGENDLKTVMKHKWPGELIVDSDEQFWITSRFKHRIERYDTYGNSKLPNMIINVPKQYSSELQNMFFGGSNLEKLFVSSRISYSNKLDPVGLYAVNVPITGCKKNKIKLLNVD